MKLKTMLQRCAAKLFGGSSVLLVPGLAFASGGSGGVDVSAVVSAIGAAATPIASIGAAVLLVLVGIKVYKWVRRAM